jgi:hypothetical protein
MIWAPPLAPPPSSECGSPPRRKPHSLAGEPNHTTVQKLWYSLYNTHFTIQALHSFINMYRARICKRSRSPGIYSKPMQLSGSERLVGFLYRTARLEIDSWAHKRFTNSGSVQDCTVPTFLLIAYSKFCMFRGSNHIEVIKVWVISNYWIIKVLKMSRVVP